MITNRYQTAGRWFKGNTHIHSTASDGGKTFEQLAADYAGAGYDFLFRTDHWVSSDTAADATPYPLLWLDGMELDGSDHGGSNYHVVCLGTFKGISREAGFVQAMETVRAQGGLLILAHPHWMGNSTEDALRWGFHGVEVYNHVCQWLNGKGDSMIYWHAMLGKAPATLAFSSDDAHIRPEHPGWNGGWIMVNTPELSRENILDAIRAGNFYSTTGPRFEAIECAGNQIRLKTSPVQFVRLVGPGWSGLRLGSFGADRLTEATFEIPADWPYMYLEIEDDQGHRAWTNPL